MYLLILGAKVKKILIRKEEIRKKVCFIGGANFFLTSNFRLCVIQKINVNLQTKIAIQRRFF